MKKTEIKFIRCPMCGSPQIQKWNNDEVKTTLNMNPLKPFTLVNHKKVKKTVKKVSKAKVAVGVATCGLSLLATGVRKKVELDSYFCTECGCQWEEEQ